MELSEGIFLIYGQGFGRYPYANCLLIAKDCLIDGGAEKVWNLRPEIVLNSHWHEDHIAMNRVAKYVFAHELDSKAIESYDEFKARYGLGEKVDVFLRLYPNLGFREVNGFFFR